MRIAAIFLVCVIRLGIAQEADTMSVAAEVARPDSVNEKVMQNDSAAGDSVNVGVLSESPVMDSTLMAQAVDTAVVVDTGAAEVASQSEESTGIKKIKLIKREYNYGQQLRLAIGMMAFIAVIMASSQNWNPK